MLLKKEYVMSHPYKIDPKDVRDLHAQIDKARGAVTSQDPLRIALIVGHDIHPDEVQTVLKLFLSHGVHPDVFQVLDDDGLGIVGSGWEEEESEEPLRHWASSGAWRRLTPAERAKKRNDVWLNGIDWPVRWILDPDRSKSYALVVSAYVPIMGANLRWAMACFVHGGAASIEWESPQLVDFLCFAPNKIEEAIFSIG